MLEREYVREQRTSEKREHQKSEMTKQQAFQDHVSPHTDYLGANHFFGSQKIWAGVGGFVGEHNCGLIGSGSSCVRILIKKIQKSFDSKTMV